MRSLLFLCFFLLINFTAVYAQPERLFIPAIGVSILPPDTGFVSSSYFNGVAQRHPSGAPIRISINAFPLVPFALVAADVKNDKSNSKQYRVWLCDTSVDGIDIVASKYIGPDNKLPGLQKHFSDDSSMMVHWMAVYQIGSEVFVANCKYPLTADGRWHANIKLSLLSLSAASIGKAPFRTLPFELRTAPPIASADPYTDNGMAYVLKNDQNKAVIDWQCNVHAIIDAASPEDTRKEVLSSSLHLAGHSTFNAPYGPGWEYYYYNDDDNKRKLFYYAIIPAPNNALVSVNGEATAQFEAAIRAFQQMSRAVVPKPY